MGLSSPIMFSRLVLYTVFILPIVVFTSTLPAEDGLLFSNTELSSNNAELSSDGLSSPLDPTASLLDLGQLPGDAEFSPTDTSDSLFQDPNSSISTSSETDNNGIDSISADNAFTSDDSLDLADCSASQYPPIGKSRVRRLDGSESCKTETDTTATGSVEEPTVPGFDEVYNLIVDPGTRRKLAAEVSSGESNILCYILTSGFLPWEVCSSGLDEDQRISTSQRTIPGFLPVFMLSLARCRLGMLSRRRAIFDFADLSAKFDSIRVGADLSRSKVAVILLSILHFIAIWHGKERGQLCVVVRTG